MIRLALAGARGRMGRCTLDLLASDPRFEVCAVLSTSTSTDGPGVVITGGRSYALSSAIPSPCDVVLDFGATNGVNDWLPACLRLGIPWVTGVTGYDAEQTASIIQASKHIPVVQSSNFSRGMNALIRALGTVVDGLPADQDMAIVETHRRGKRDAPSGTALALCRVLERSLVDRDSPSEHRSASDRGTCRDRTIEIHSLRQGDTVGRHEVRIVLAGERLCLSHEALSRDAFAHGALDAAAWIMGKPPGLYDTIQMPFGA